VSAIEFALVAPLFCFILVAVLEFGNILHQRFELDAALSAGANYALVNGGTITPADASIFAANIATVVNAKAGTGWSGLSVVVNNASTLDIAPGGLSPTTGGTAANADRCYCPGAAAGLDWTTSYACGVNCPAPNAAVTAGKYVQIALDMPYTPILSGYGFVEDGTISVSTVIRTQ
jgi:Flp pilus assembly protein TadG